MQAISATALGSLPEPAMTAIANRLLSGHLNP